MLAVTFVVVVYAAGARLSHLAMAAAPALAVAAGLLISSVANGSARNLSGSLGRSTKDRIPGWCSR